MEIKVESSTVNRELKRPFDIWVQEMCHFFVPIDTLHEMM